MYCMHYGLSEVFMDNGTKFIVHKYLSLFPYTANSTDFGNFPEHRIVYVYSSQIIS